VPDLTASIMEPLTIQMTEEQLRKKHEQQKAKAPPPGTSRILSRATKEQKKQNKQQQQQTPANANNNQQTQPKQTEPPQQTQKQQPIEQVPKNQSPLNENQIIKEKEHQSKQQNLSPNPQGNENEEWQNLIEELNPETNFEFCEKMIQDDSFLARLKNRLNQSKNLMFDSKIEGASMFREVCKILSNLLSIEFDDEDEDDVTMNEEDNNDIIVSSLSKTLKAESSKANEKSISSKIIKTTDNKQLQLIEKFCSYLELPNFFIDLLKEFLVNDKSANIKNLKSQPWFHQIELDIVALLNSYFSSQLSTLDIISPATRSIYLKSVKEFTNLSTYLLYQQNDADLSIRERTMIVCEYFNIFFSYF
jgi:hypothetical protein